MKIKPKPSMTVTPSSNSGDHLISQSDVSQLMRNCF